MARKTNTSNLYNGDEETPLQSASSPFDVYDLDMLEMSKTTDKNTVYFSGDPITFTITISNQDSETTLTDLVVKDTIDASINYPSSQTEFTVTATSGTVTQANREVTVSNITIAPSGSVTITINGVVA